MGNENTILTALGLDTSQFEDGTGRATRATYGFTQAANALHSELISIPIIGDLYRITFGRIVEGFAEAREQGREFARIMRTDVSGSLEGTVGKIEDINKSLKDLKTGSAGRIVADFFKDTAGAAKTTGGNLGIPKGVEFLKAFTSALIPDAAKKAGSWYAENFAEGAETVGGFLKKNAIGETQGDRRAQQIKDEEEARRNLVESLVPLYDRMARAQSSSYSKSVLETEQLKIQAEAATKRAALEEEATKLFGPNVEDRPEADNKAMQAKLDAIGHIEDAESHAAQMRYQAHLDALNHSKEQTNLELSGNERLRAAEDVANARRKQATAITNEEKQAAFAALEIAYKRQEIAKKEYDFAVRNAELQTQHQQLLVTGQTRAAKQAEIRMRFEVQIAQAMQHQNKELAEQLKAQEKAARFAEAEREYDLGGRGRARERKQERDARHHARVVASRENARNHPEGLGGGLTTYGLGDHGGLFAGHIGIGLPRPRADKPASTPTPVSIKGMEDFATKLFEALKQ